MKTAMQELIETIDIIVKLLPNEALGTKNQAIIIKTKATELLEKEKQQIIDSYHQGYNRDEDSGYSDPLDYYNETFKH